METPTDEAEAKKANDELVTIAGGVELEITHLDGSQETVKVRQIPISKINSFIMSLGDEAVTIEFYCDKEKGWADTLTTQSASEVADKGQELNLPFFVAWFRRQAKWRQGQAQGGIGEPGIKTETPTGTPSVSSVQPSPTTTT
jgi:hypothetical protein